jgi:hypothetical protein
MRALKAAAALLLLGTAVLPGRAQTPKKAAASCQAPEYRQLDFWVGDWDTYDLDGAGNPAKKVVARNRVDRILGGCALREVYEQTDGLVGQSFSTYDASRKVWHQTWVTNRGQLLVVEGGLEGDRLILTGPLPVAGGPPGTLRVAWQPRKDGVRETAESSGDGGKTWKPLFDVLFRPHKP